MDALIFVVVLVVGASLCIVLMTRAFLGQAKKEDPPPQPRQPTPDQELLITALRKELRDARGLIKELQDDHHLLNALDLAWRHGEIIQIRPRNDGLVSFEVSAPGRYYQTAAFSVREAIRRVTAGER